MPGTIESLIVNTGDCVGRLFAALKTADDVANWSQMSNLATSRVGGYRIKSSFPADGRLLTPTVPEVLFFGTGGGIKSAAAAISSSPFFPAKAVPRPGGGVDSSLRIGLKYGDGSLKFSKGNWKKLRALVQPDGIIHWRVEGKAKVGKIPVYVYGPTRSAYFDIGSITGLAVSPSHDISGRDGLWPDPSAAPTFSWTSNSPTSVKFFLDVSRLPEVPLGDKKNTLTLGGKGIAGASYQLAPAEWQKARLLARGDTHLYWRVRGTDADGLLGCGSGVREMDVDSGEWATAGPASLAAAPATFEWTNTGSAHGIAGYSLQFSVGEDFASEAGLTLSLPKKAVSGFSYTLSESEKSVLRKLAAKNE